MKTNKTFTAVLSNGRQLKIDAPNLLAALATAKRVLLHRGLDLRVVSCR